MKTQQVPQRTQLQKTVSPTLVKTTAHSIYQNLVDEGYAMRDIIALSSQLLGLASADLVTAESKENVLPKTANLVNISK